MRYLRAAAVAGLVCVSAQAALVDDVRLLMRDRGLPAAESAVRAAQAQNGGTPEVAAAISWLARGALAAKQWTKADSYAAETRTVALRALGMRRLDSDPWLPTAVGAAIEVHAGVLASQGRRAEAVAYLQDQLKTWGATSLRERIQKNINLLGLEGKPAPPLAGVNLTGLKGRPVLLFFWAHWCPDCKAEAPIVAAAEKRFPSLAVVGPTRLYGYAAGGDPAPPDAEKKYIEEIRKKYYASLATMPAPINSANFETYGASTTPTMVLLDRAGNVRMYHPGAVPQDELFARIQALVQ
jgi:thiol-disulfide isomerase/thioredoxin